MSATGQDATELPPPDPLIFPDSPVCPECGDDTDCAPGNRWRCVRCGITWADDGTDGRREPVASAAAGEETQ